MHSITDPNIDQVIRDGLKAVDAKGKLSALAAVTSIPGGEARLREIIASSEPLDYAERGMLGMHL